MNFAETFRQQKWMTLGVLALLLASTAVGFFSLWGLLFIFWAVTAARSGQAYLIEPINRAEDPGLFWLLTVLWGLFGLIYIAADFYPALMNG